MTFLEHVVAAVLAGRGGLALTRDAAALPLIRNRVVQTDRSRVEAVSPRVTHLDMSPGAPRSEIIVLDLRQIDPNSESIAAALDTARLVVAPINASDLSQHGLQPISGSDAMHVRGDLIDSEAIMLAEVALESGSAMALVRRYNTLIDTPARLPRINLAGSQGAEIQLAPSTVLRFGSRSEARDEVTAGGDRPSNLTLSLPAITGSRIVLSVHDPRAVLADELDVTSEWPVRVHSGIEQSEFSIEVPDGAAPSIGIAIHGRAPRITRVCIETGYCGPQIGTDDPLAGYGDPLAAY